VQLIPTRSKTFRASRNAIRVSKPYKLISLDLRPEKTIVRVGDATIGETAGDHRGTVTLSKARASVRVAEACVGAAPGSSAAGLSTSDISITLFRVWVKQD